MTTERVTQTDSKYIYIYLLNYKIFVKYFGIYLTVKKKKKSAPSDEGSLLIVYSDILIGYCIFKKWK